MSYKKLLDPPPYSIPGTRTGAIRYSECKPQAYVIVIYQANGGDRKTNRSILHY